MPGRFYKVAVLFLCGILVYAATNSTAFLDVAKRKASDVVSDAAYDSYGKCDLYENIIALTFDDGPHIPTTEKLLDGLKERNVKATFFLVGNNIAGRENIVKRMAEEGHLIGNHTYSHIDLQSVGRKMVISEIVKTNRLICDITGEMPYYVRLPYGRSSEKLMEQVNMTPVLWSVDPDDWATSDVERVVNHVVSHTNGRDIILMHDIYETSVVAALEIIDRLQDKGFIFVTVDELLLD